MQTHRTSCSRRTILKAFAVTPLVTFAGYQSSATAAMLSVDDPDARSRGYVESSDIEGRSCANCKLFVKKGKQSGRCVLFSGKEVSSTGLCNTWMSKT